jgi:hypothetical protein
MTWTITTQAIHAKVTMTAELRPRLTHVRSSKATSEADGASSGSLGSENKGGKGRRGTLEYSGRYDIKSQFKTRNNTIPCFKTYDHQLLAVIDPPSFASRTRKWCGQSRAMGDQSNRHKTFLSRARHRVVCLLSTLLLIYVDRITQGVR